MRGSACLRGQDLRPLLVMGTSVSYLKVKEMQDSRWRNIIGLTGFARGRSPRRGLGCWRAHP